MGEQIKGDLPKSPKINGVEGGGETSVGKDNMGLAKKKLASVKKIRGE